MPSRARTRLAALVPVVAVCLLAGCAARPAAPGRTITVTASDSGCSPSRTSLASGTATITVRNTGSRSTEFELLGADGGIRTEVENLAPSLTRTLTVTLYPGDYTSVCKPGMSGPGVGRTTLHVTGTAAAPKPTSTALAGASAAYLTFVRDEAATLLAETRAFADTYVAGDAAKAKALYPGARASYERIEPVAEAFGTLDAQLDAREADVAPGVRWTGWHRIEKSLWQQGGAPLSAAQRRQQASALVSATQALVAKVDARTFTLGPDRIGNGAVALLDEVAATKITGEEETWSHTDLSDFQANVDGAHEAYAVVREAAKAKDPALVATLDARFAALDVLLGRYGSIEHGFVPYTRLTKAQVKQLSDALNALSEPLSTLTATVMG